jgi:uncharacterized membrane protein YhaH (DUF805 family)
MNEAPLPRRIVAPLGRLLDFGGRTRRADYWPYMLALMGLWLADLIVEIVLIPNRFGSPVVHGYALIAILVLLAFAATVRRLHDVGWSGRWMAAYVAMMLGFITFALYWRYGILHRPYGQQNIPLVRLMPLLMALGLAMDGLGLLVFILSLLDGTPGPNRYGPDPKGRSAA